ncbi:hypothetical protein H9P43_002249 [Blastocladiella emersonii ATCC 22665]|nr:hypothetical protein H9P43_002249 [Blastocladiella emersonii ATCC 22665]
MMTFTGLFKHTQTAAARLAAGQRHRHFSLLKFAMPFAGNRPCDIYKSVKSSQVKHLVPHVREQFPSLPFSGSASETVWLAGFASAIEVINANAGRLHRGNERPRERLSIPRPGSPVPSSSLAGGLLRSSTAADDSDGELGLARDFHTGHPMLPPISALLPFKQPATGTLDDHHHIDQARLAELGAVLGMHDAEALYRSVQLSRDPVSMTNAHNKSLTGEANIQGYTASMLRVLCPEYTVSTEQRVYSRNFGSSGYGRCDIVMSMDAAKFAALPPSERGVGMLVCEVKPNETDSTKAMSQAFSYLMSDTAREHLKVQHHMCAMTDEFPVCGAVMWVAGGSVHILVVPYLEIVRMREHAINCTTPAVPIRMISLTAPAAVASGDPRALFESTVTHSGGFFNLVGLYEPLNRVRNLNFSPADRAMLCEPIRAMK